MSELSRAKSLVNTVWWLVLLRGVIAVLFGIMVLARPGASAAALVLVFGVFSIVDGVAELFIGFRAKGQNGRGLTVLAGILSILTGVVALAWPGITALVLLYLIAFWAIVIGILEIVGAFGLKNQGLERWWWHVIGGLSLVALGIILLARNPAKGILGLLVVLGILAIIEGVSFIVAALVSRRDVKEIKNVLDDAIATSPERGI